MNYRLAKSFVRRLVLPPKGTIFRTKSKLLDPAGYFIGETGNINRKVREFVEYIDFVPSYGGDVWWCRNTSDGTIAAYNVLELI